MIRIGFWGILYSDPKIVWVIILLHMLGVDGLGFRVSAQEGLHRRAERHRAVRLPCSTMPLLNPEPYTLNPKPYTLNPIP